jgi:hypothetical protein
VDFLHHGIRLDLEVGDDGVDVRRRSGCVAVSVVEKDVDSGTSFLAAAYRLRSVAVACSSSRS